jgi:hypothetical protein
MIAVADQVLALSRSSVKQGRIECRQVAGSVIASADDLGLSLADVLGWYRVFILVEGEHDRILIETLLGGTGGGLLVPDLLTSSRSRVVAMGGVKGASPTLTSSLLTDFTDVPLLVVVDGLRAPIAAVWEQLLALAARNPKDARRRALKDLEGDSYEREFLRSALLNAIEHGHVADLERVKLFSFDAMDCVELLPVKALRPDLELEWSDLRVEWEQAGKKGAFKRFVADRHGLRIRSDTLRAALERLADEDFPNDIVRLGRTLQDLARSQDP